MNRRQLVAGAVAGLLSIAAAADDPADRLKDPAEEARARRLFKTFRCLVCQNESIDDSQASLARDLRQIVRAQIAQGRTDAQITAFMTDRYGEFILLKPRLSEGNALLWLTPALILLGGGAFFAWRARRPAVLETALSPEEESKLRSLDFGTGSDAVAPKKRRRASLGMTER